MTALLLAALLSAAPDAPTVVRLSDGSMQVSPESWQRIDDEVKRLQRIEKQHANEIPIGWVVVGMLAIGATAGVVTTAVVMQK